MGPLLRLLGLKVVWESQTPVVACGVPPVTFRRAGRSWRPLLLPFILQRAEATGIELYDTAAVPGQLSTSYLCLSLPSSVLLHCSTQKINK